MGLLAGTDAGLFAGSDFDAANFFLFKYKKRATAPIPIPYNNFLSIILFF
jgi:hypothetical protein